MKIKLNEKILEVDEGTTLKALLESQQISMQGMAVAIEYKVVSKSKWEQTILTEGMHLILIQAISGG